MLMKICVPDLDFIFWHTSAKSLEEIYDLDIVPLTLDDIVEFISNVPTDISAKFIADQESVMTYEMDSLSTSKSYLVKLTLANVIRITCVNDQFRNDTAIEYEKLKDAYILKVARQYH